MRKRIGLVGQTAALDESLSGRENLVMFGRLSHVGTARRAGGQTSCSERFGLETLPIGR